MSNDKNLEPEGLPDALRDDLRELRDDPALAPPEGLEERVVRTLSDRGLLAAGPTGGSARRWFSAALAAGLLLVLGFAAGRLSSGASVPAGNEARWALLIHGGSQLPQSMHQEERVARVVEWLRRLRSDGIDIDGERLLQESWRVRPSVGDVPRIEDATSAARISGFFLVDGGTQEKVLEIAAGWPLPDGDGWVEVRPVATDASR